MAYPPNSPVFRRRFFDLALAVTVLFLFSPQFSLQRTFTVAQENWPGFRNDGSGVITSKSLPTRWSTESGIAWRTEIPGYGQSSPVAWKNRIFLTSCNGPFQQQGWVHCFDLNTGEKTWTTEVTATTKVENYFRNSRAAPTCVVDQKRVYSFFPGGDVTAMDHAGQALWTVPLFKKFGSAINERGTASSLAQTKDLVFVLVDHEGPSYLVAIDKQNGVLKWKAERGKRVPSWSSPLVVRHQDRELVVVSSADTVDAYDAKDGKSLWSIDGLKGNHIPSASIVDGSIYVGSTQMWHGDFDPQKVAASNCRIDLTTVDGKPSYQLRWGAQSANSYYSSPLCFDGYVYYVNKSGVLFCVDRESGERLYAKRIGNPCWASAIGVRTEQGNLVYLFMKNGSAVVIRTGKTYQQVARNRLWDIDEMKKVAEAAARLRKQNAVPPDQAKPKTGPEKMLSGLSEESLHRMFSYGDPIVYAAIVVDGKLLIRTGQHLYCVKEPAKKSTKK